MKKQSGFAIIETIVVLVIFVVIAGVGFAVWSRNHDTSSKAKSATAASSHNSNDDKSTAKLGKDCSSGTMKGKLFMAEKAEYSICLPDGWNVLVLGGNSFGAEENDLTYVKGTQPIISFKEGGGEGPSVFGLYYNATTSGAPANFNTVGQFQAQNVTGTEYARTETKTQEGLGGVPKGTLQHVYYFEKGGKSIEIDYNLEPGNVDRTDAVVAVAKTLLFN